MNTQPIGQDRFASFDQSESRIRQAAFVHKPGWFGAFIWCLQHSDYEAAEIIHDAQEPDSLIRFGD